MKLIKKSNNLYSKFVIYITLLIILSIAVSSFIQYAYSRNNQLSQLYLSSRDSLSQIGYSANFMVDSAKSLLVQMHSDADLSNLLYYKEVDPPEMQRGLNKLATYSNSMPFVHSIYLYNSFNDSFYTNFSSVVEEKSASFFDQEIVNILSKDNYTYSFIPLARKIAQPGLNTGSDMYSNAFTFLFGDSTKVNKSASLIVLNISELWIRKVITSMDTNSSGSIFITDDDGKIISSVYSTEVLTSISDKAYFKKIYAQKQPSGYFVDNADGRKSLIIYTSNPELNWKFIRIIPYENVVRHLNSLAVNTAVICLIILLIGLAASLAVSRRLYKPIGTIISKLNTLSAESRKNSSLLKQEFLKKLLQRETPYSQQAIIKNFSAYEIKFKLENPVVLVLFKIDRFSEFCLKYNFNDRSLIRFGIMNVVSELSAPFFENETVEMGEDHIVLLLNTDFPPAEDENKKINELIGSIQSNIHKYLEISLSASFSKSDNMLSGVNDSYQQALDASFLRVFYGYMCIIDAEETGKSLDYAYPYQKEKHLAAALTAGKAEDVKEYFREIVNNSLSSYPLSTLNTTLLHITFTINMAVDTIEKSTGIPIDFNFNRFISELNSLETMQEIYVHFYRMFDHIIERFEEKKSNKYDQVIASVKSIIVQNYADPGLYLEQIADKINMSPTYLGRLFKKNTLKSVADYINDVRMEKATHFLQTTDLPINEVAEKSGFTSSNYFYAIFKKEYGVTPNEYRKRKPHNALH